MTDECKQGEAGSNVGWILVVMFLLGDLTGTVTTIFAQTPTYILVSFGLGILFAEVIS